MYRSFPKPPIPLPQENSGTFDCLKKIGPLPLYVASLDGQMPHPLELEEGQIPHPPVMLNVKAIVQTFFACVKPFIQMYICNKQLATAWIYNRTEQKSRGCFTAYIYLYIKKRLIQRIISIAKRKRSFT